MKVKLTTSVEVGVIVNVIIAALVIPVETEGLGKVPLGEVMVCGIIGEFVDFLRAPFCDIVYLN